MLLGSGSVTTQERPCCPGLWRAGSRPGKETGPLSWRPRCAASARPGEPPQARGSDGLPAWCSCPLCPDTERLTAPCVPPYLLLCLRRAAAGPPSQGHRALCALLPIPASPPPNQTGLAEAWVLTLLAHYHPGDPGPATCLLKPWFSGDEMGSTGVCSLSPQQDQTTRAHGEGLAPGRGWKMLVKPDEPF